MKALKETWSELAYHYSSDGQLISKLWNEIKTAYDSRGRHYHNLHHIAYVLGDAEEYDSMLDDRDCVLFALFYHDIVYDVLRTDNEEQSAEIAKSRLSELGPDLI